MSPNEASFMDKWYSLYPALDTQQIDFMTVDSFDQSPRNKPANVQPKPIEEYLE